MDSVVQWNSHRVYSASWWMSCWGESVCRMKRGRISSLFPFWCCWSILLLYLSTIFIYVHFTQVLLKLNICTLAQRHFPLTKNTLITPYIFHFVFSKHSLQISNSMRLFFSPVFFLVWYCSWLELQIHTGGRVSFVFM